MGFVDTLKRLGKHTAVSLLGTATDTLVLWFLSSVVFKSYVGVENTKAQDAVLVAKDYLLMKINSKAYKFNFDRIKSVLDN